MKYIKFFEEHNNDIYRMEKNRTNLSEPAFTWLHHWTWDGVWDLEDKSIAADLLNAHWNDVFEELRKYRPNHSVTAYRAIREEDREIESEKVLLSYSTNKRMVQGLVNGAKFDGEDSYMETRVLDPKYILVDVNMIEKGDDHFCDEIIYINVPEFFDKVNLD